MIKFSVLMSVYYKESPDNLIECFESLLRQTQPANEWVLVLDGPLTLELDKVIQEYVSKYPKLIKIVALEKNVGLGLALREGVCHCSHDYIARMDTDDICVNTRFEKQIEFLETHSDVDICGGQIAEFEGSVENVIAIRKVPLEDDKIKKYQRTRCAFNHVTVFFKKQAVLSAGNYENAPLTEDDMLWARMILANKKMANLPEILVYVRVGRDMIKRRGGLAYYRKYRASRKKIFKLGFMSYCEYKRALRAQFLVCLMPAKLRKFVFYKLLREKPTSKKIPRQEN